MCDDLESHEYFFNMNIFKKNNGITFKNIEKCKLDCQRVARNP